MKLLLCALMFCVAVVTAYPHYRHNPGNPYHPNMVHDPVWHCQTGRPMPDGSICPTSRPTQSQTAPPIAPPTRRPRPPPTQRPTQRPTAPPTQRPTAPPTQRPTAPPTQRPTAPPTPVPTTQSDGDFY